MATADNETPTLRARCGPYLARLAVLADRPPGTLLPTGAAAEVAAAAGAVLAQAEEAISAAAAVQHSATGEFLAARLARLKTAADDAVTAARGGDVATLRGRLRQFGVLTSALWTVHEAVIIPAPRIPARGLPRGRPGR